MSIFETSLKKGSNFSLEHLNFRFVNTNTSDPSKFSFVVPSGVSKKAVVRNLLKRRARHIIRKQLDKIKDGYIGAFFFKKGANTLKFDKLESEINSSLLKIGIIK